MAVDVVEQHHDMMAVPPHGGFAGSGPRTRKFEPSRSAPERPDWCSEYLDGSTAGAELAPRAAAGMGDNLTRMCGRNYQAQRERRQNRANHDSSGFLARIFLPSQTMPKRE